MVVSYYITITFCARPWPCGRGRGGCVRSMEVRARGLDRLPRVAEIGRSWDVAKLKKNQRRRRECRPTQRETKPRSRPVRAALERSGPPRDSVAVPMQERSETALQGGENRKIGVLLDAAISNTTPTLGFSREK